MKAAYQRKFFKLAKSDVFGGSLLKGNAKKARFIPRTIPVHITLKSEMATGAYSMLLHDRYIRELIQRQAKLAGVKLYDFVNVGNHIHILARCHNRFLYRRFIRSITGIIARRVIGAERGSAKGLKFWSYRPYTKLIAAGDLAALSFMEIIKDWDEAMSERCRV